MVVYMLETKDPARRRGTVRAMTRKMTGAYCFTATETGTRQRYGRDNRLSLVCTRKTNDDD